MNKIYTEARCRILWGDDSKSVSEFLVESNVEPAKAEKIIADLLVERSRSIKKIGTKKAAKGLVAFAGSGALLIVLFSVGFFEPTARTGDGWGAFALLGIVSVWGLWSGIDGVLLVLHPDKFTGNVGARID